MQARSKRARLFHGTIQHGAQFIWADKQRRPLTYYGRDSGIGIVLRECLPDAPRRVGVIGLVPARWRLLADRATLLFFMNSIRR